MIEISDSTYKKLQAALILSEEDEATVMDKLVVAYAKKVFAEEAQTEGETAKHRWTFEEDFIVCKNFIDKYVVQKSAAGIQTVVSKVKEELPEINEGSVRMKMQNISALCSKYQVAATAKIKNLGQYSTQLEKAFKAAMAELKVKPEDLQEDEEVAESIDAVADELNAAIDDIAEEAENFERSVEEDLEAFADELDEELEKLDGVLDEEEKEEGPSKRQKVAESAEKFIKSAEPVVKNVMGTAVTGLAKAAEAMAAGLAKVAESANKAATEAAEAAEETVTEATGEAADTVEEAVEEATEAAEEVTEAAEEVVEEVTEKVEETTEQ